VSPSRTTFTSLDDVPDYIIEATPYFIMTISIEAAFYIFKNRKALKKQDGKWDQGKLRVNDMIGSISSGIVQQLMRYFVKGLELSAYIYVWNNFRLYEMDATKLSTWILCFLTTDLGYYWFHRSAHEINIMWAGHVVHHSSEYYNQTTALRQSFFQPMTSWMFYLPAAFFIPPTMFAVHKQLVTIYQYWIHTETVGRLGWLEYIVNTPSAHRVHHGRNPYCIDKNYAGTLIIWDRMFGTYADERVYPDVVSKKEDEEKVAYGLTHPIDTFDPVEVQTHHLKHVARTFWHTKGISNKLKVLFYGPGWHDDTPRLGLNSEIPPISKTQPPVKHDPIIPTSMTTYSLIHTGALIALYDYTVLTFSAGDFNGKLMAAWIASGLYTLGRILDGKRNAPLLEMGRVAVGIYILPKMVGLPANTLYGMRSLYGVSVLLMAGSLVTQGSNWSKMTSSKVKTS
jgi:alkylglycerol monooxygenase